MIASLFHNQHYTLKTKLITYVAFYNFNANTDQITEKAAARLRRSVIKLKFTFCYQSAASTLAYISTINGQKQWNKTILISYY